MVRREQKKAFIKDFSKITNIMVMGDFNTKMELFWMEIGIRVNFWTSVRLIKINIYNY